MFVSSGIVFKLLECSNGWIIDTGDGYSRSYNKTAIAKTDSELVEAIKLLIAEARSEVMEPKKNG